MNTPNNDFRTDLDINETLTPFDAMEQTGRRAMLLLLASLGFLLILALIIFNVYQPGVRDRNAPPTINAENTPFKYKPDNPGGQIAPDQDKEIYKAMNGRSSDGTVIPSPQAEIPITIPKSANISVEPAISVKPATKSIINAPKPAVQPKVQPKTTVVTSAGNSNYVVQLASVRSREAAEQLWNGLNTKFRRDLSPPLYADIKRADLGDKGVFYRLRVAGFSSKDNAVDLCNSLKGRQQACFVTRK